MWVYKVVGLFGMPISIGCVFGIGVYFQDGFADVLLNFKQIIVKYFLNLYE